MPQNCHTKVQEMRVRESDHKISTRADEEPQNMVREYCTSADKTTSALKN